MSLYNIPGLTDFDSALIELLFILTHQLGINELEFWVQRNFSVSSLIPPSFPMRKAHFSWTLWNSWLMGSLIKEHRSWNMSKIKTFPHSLDLTMKLYEIFFKLWLKITMPILVAHETWPNIRCQTKGWRFLPWENFFDSTVSFSARFILRTKLCKIFLNF